MPKAYSDDVRTKFLDAYAAGRGGLQELASVFGFSYGYAKKIRRQQLQSGACKRPSQSWHGPEGLLTAQIEAFLRKAVAAQPDVTLAELARRLDRSHRVQISSSRLWYWLRGLGLRHKKNAAGAGTGTRRELMAAPDVVGSARRGRSRLPGVSR